MQRITICFVIFMFFNFEHSAQVILEKIIGTNTIDSIIYNGHVSAVYFPRKKEIKFDFGNINEPVRTGAYKVDTVYKSSYKDELLEFEILIDDSLKWKLLLDSNNNKLLLSKFSYHWFYYGKSVKVCIRNKLYLRRLLAF